MPKGTSEKTIRSAAGLFKLLGQVARLELIVLMNDAEINVGEMCLASGLSQPVVSNQLSLLRISGLIEGRREGKCVFYSPTDKGRVAIDCMRRMSA